MTEFTLINHDNEKTKTFDSRADAEENRDDMIGLGVAAEELDVVPGAWDTYEAAHNDIVETDGGNTEVVNSPEPTDPGGPNVAETPDTDPRESEVVDAESESESLPDRDVSDNPFDWLPGHFVDHIEGEPAINRRGYAVLSEFYDISVVSDVVVGPEETDFEYCRCEATATDAEGNEYRAHGSAHVERGDDMELLLEMADTRATKRVLAIATGVGAVSVSELKNEL